MTTTTFRFTTGTTTNMNTAYKYGTGTQLQLALDILHRYLAPITTGVLQAVTLVLLTAAVATGLVLLWGIYLVLPMWAQWTVQALSATLVAGSVGMGLGMALDALRFRLLGPTPCTTVDPDWDALFQAEGDLWVLDRKSKVAEQIAAACRDMQRVVGSYTHGWARRCS